MTLQFFNRPCLCGPLDFSRRDLMAQNIQRGRDHGLPDYNTARVSLGLSKIENFSEINQLMFDGDETDITEDVSFVKTRRLGMRVF